MIHTIISPKKLFRTLLRFTCLTLVKARCSKFILDSIITQKENNISKPSNCHTKIRQTHFHLKFEHSFTKIKLEVVMSIYFLRNLCLVDPMTAPVKSAPSMNEVIKLQKL